MEYSCSKSGDIVDLMLGVNWRPLCVPAASVKGWMSPSAPKAELCSFCSNMLQRSSLQKGFPCLQRWEAGFGRASCHPLTATHGLLEHQVLALGSGFEEIIPFLLWYHRKELLVLCSLTYWSKKSLAVWEDDLTSWVNLLNAFRKISSITSWELGFTY